MKTNRRGITVLSIMVCFAVWSSLSAGFAEEYDAMKGVDSVKVFFDMRDGIPEVAAAHMSLIHETYQQLTSMNKKPAFVIVFMGSAVKVISKDRSAFSPEDQKHLEEIAETVARMSAAGIRLEACLAAVKYFKVDPSSIPSTIKQVGNGWISEIGYQARGYTLVPVY